MGKRTRRFKKQKRQRTRRSKKHQRGGGNTLSRNIPKEAVIVNPPMIDGGYKFEDVSMP